MESLFTTAPAQPALTILVVAIFAAFWHWHHRLLSEENAAIKTWQSRTTPKPKHTDKVPTKNSKAAYELIRTNKERPAVEKEIYKIRRKILLREWGIIILMSAYAAMLIFFNWR